MPNSRKTSSGAAKATASRISSVCEVWSRSFCLQRSFGPRNGFRSTGRQQLFQESVAQVRNLDHARLCGLCATTPPMQLLRKFFPHFETSSSAMPFRTADSPDIRTQRPMARVPFSSLLTARSQCPQGDPFDDSPLPNCSIWDMALTERDKRLPTKLRRSSAMALPRCIVSSFATASAESLEGAISGHQSWALPLSLPPALGRGHPNAQTENAELKLRLRLWEAWQVSERNLQDMGEATFRPLRMRKRVMQPQTDEQRRKRACRLDSPRIPSAKPRKDSAGLCRLSEN